MKKKLLSWFLVVMMAMGLMTTAAFATTGVEPVVTEPTRVATKDELDKAIANAVDGAVIKLEADIDYGNNQLKIEKAITLDLGGKTLTNSFGYGGLSLKGNCSVKNGTIDHKGGVAAIKAWNVASLEDLTITVAERPGKTVGGIVIQEGAAVRIGSIKNVTIKGEGLTNGIETYNCGTATENVIGSMENVTIDAKDTGMLISAPCGTATNCNIKGGVSGIEIWIKGTYSATLDLDKCTVEGGRQAVFAHDEFNSDPDIQNNGVLKLTMDEETELKSENGKTLNVAIKRAENVDLTDVIEVEVDGTYYGTLAEAVEAANAKDGAVTITLLRGISEIDLRQFTGTSLTLDASAADFDGVEKVKITCKQIADGLNSVTAPEQSGSYIIKNFDVDGNLSIGSCATTVTVEGCTVEAMDFDASNTALTIANNVIAGDSEYIRYNGYDWQKYDSGVYIYADNYDLIMTNNDITAKGKAITIQGNYEQYQNKGTSYDNSITMTGNTFRTTEDDALIKFFNDVTYAPVAWPADYEITEAMKSLAKQILEENNTGSCAVDVLNIHCRAANNKPDIQVTEKHNLLKAIAEAAEKVNPRDHKWGDWCITTPATTTAAGVKTATCECGATKTETIPMLPTPEPDYDYDYDPTYRVEINSDIDNGSVSTRVKYASSGDTVSITVTPDEGYELDELTVTDSKGNEIEVTYKNGKYTFKMPARKVIIHAAFISAAEMPFVDVDADDWYYDAVQYAYDNDIMAGVGGSKFDPNAELTRAMVAQVLYNLDEDRYTTSANLFADVIVGEWYVDAINWAVSEGIFAGYGNGNFGTLDSVTREQLAMILCNYAVSKGYEISGSITLGMYADADKTSGWAVGAMEWAVANGILRSTDGLLTPTAPASRAEVAYAMMMFCENILG